MRLRKTHTLILLVLSLLLASCDTGLPTPLTPTPNASPTATAPTEDATATAVTAEPSPTTNQPATATQAQASATVPATVSPGAGGILGCPAATTDKVPLDSIGDPFYPNMGNAGYDTLHYNIDLDVNVDANTITGTTTISARAIQPLKDLDLDFQGFNAGKVTVDGSAASVSRSGGEMRITPSSSLASGQAFTITVPYSGVPQGDVDAVLGSVAGWVKYPGGIYVASEPGGASAWYPVNNHPCDKATYTFRITAPKPYVVAANGLLKQTTDNGTTTTYLWESRYPMASYLATVDIAQYDVQTQTGPNGLPIRVYFPKDVAQENRSAFNTLPDIIDFFSSKFGPYPFEAAGAVLADQELGFALETQTLILFGKDVAVGSHGAESVIAHETSHQWFGDSVSLKRWKDIWLNEGFATFAEWLWLEHTSGHDRMVSEVRGAYQYAQSSRMRAPGSPDPRNLFDQSVYVRGGLTLYALRVKLGDDVFFRVLRTYADRYKYGNAGTEDFVAVAQELSGQDLKSFFDSWLYNDEMPALP